MERVRINRLQDSEEPDHPLPAKLPPNSSPGGPFRNPFYKGHPKYGGRSKGTPNKTHRQLAEAILAAATRSGFDKKGKEGLEGYLRRLANSYPKTYAYLLARVLPVQLKGRLIQEHEHRIYRSVDEVKAELNERGLPIERIFH